MIADQLFRAVKMGLSAVLVVVAVLMLVPIRNRAGFPDPIALGVFSFFMILAAVPWVFVPRNPPARALGLIMLIPTGALLWLAAQVLTGVATPDYSRPGLSYLARRWSWLFRGIDALGGAPLVAIFLAVCGCVSGWLCYRLIRRNALGS